MGRADTPEAKRIIIERIYRAWIGRPHERLGQLIENQIEGQPSNLFYIEDDHLAAAIEGIGDEFRLQRLHGPVRGL